MSPEDRRKHWMQVLTGDPNDFPKATAFLGFELIDFDVETGWCEAWFTLPSVATNPGGNAQGGFISAVLDEVMSVAGSIVQPPPAMSPTLQMTTSFIRPVPVGRRLKGRGEVVRHGRAAIFTQGWLWDDNDKHLSKRHGELYSPLAGLAFKVFGDRPAPDEDKSDTCNEFEWQALKLLFRHCA